MTDGPTGRRVGGALGRGYGFEGRVVWAGDRRLGARSVLMWQFVNDEVEGVC